MLQGVPESRARRTTEPRLAGDTIFALSSGAPPAAIGIIRVSGAGAAAALEALAGSVPAPRAPILRSLRGADGGELDRALVLWFPGPNTATGEDLAEFHCHGGRAVIRAIEGELARIPGLRRAEAGEFTRRAFLNGRIDLSEAEGLADLLAAETELQRRTALAAASGNTSRAVAAWRERILHLSAMVEAALDFSDEEDTQLPSGFQPALDRLVTEIGEVMARPGAERLREGVRVILAGPPNSGKSSLFNALIGDGAAIVSPVAGTTRDVIERSVAFDGVPFVIVDTAGLREAGSDLIEAEGIKRARDQLVRADIVLWLGKEGRGPPASIEVQAKSDCDDVEKKVSPDHVVSSVTGSGLEGLERDLVDRSRDLLPLPGEMALKSRQRELLAQAHGALSAVSKEGDLLLIAEGLRVARSAIDQLLGRASTEDMLDALFGQFCIGK